MHVVRDSVLRYPDLAARLCEPPIGYEKATQWNGYVPPDTCGNALNLSPRREALVELVNEAARRDREGWTPSELDTQPTKENL